MGEYLFDIESFSRQRERGPAPRRRGQMSREVRRALARLKRTMDAIPREELRAREQRWQLLQGGTLGPSLRT